MAQNFDTDFDLGARLRSVREKHNFSQRELARRAGITNGTISLIEQNRTSPSVGSLKKVLDGIPITLTEFFSADTVPEPRIFFGAEDFTEIGSGEISFRQVGSDMTNRALQVMQEHYGPGADTGRAMLSHEAEEAGIIIEGELEVTVDGRKQVLSAGQAYYFDSNLPHRFRNPGSTDCVIISACTPPSF